jgi:hypothetical protein
MAMGEERKNKVDEEFAKVFDTTACEFDEDEEFAKIFNKTDLEFDEDEFDKVLYTDNVEQDSDYQESLCPLLRRGCNQGEFEAFEQQWNLYAGCHGRMDERELRQQLLNRAVGPLEAVMYDTLGGKVDSLSETDLLAELEKLAVVQAVDYRCHDHQGEPCPAANSSRQPNTHSRPASPSHGEHCQHDHELHHYRAVLPVPRHDLRGEPCSAANSSQKPGSQ